MQINLQGQPVLYAGRYKVVSISLAGDGKWTVTVQKRRLWSHKFKVILGTGSIKNYTYIGRGMAWVEFSGFDGENLAVSNKMIAVLNMIISQEAGEVCARRLREGKIPGSFYDPVAPAA